jgi:hypothetical protein
MMGSMTVIPPCPPRGRAELHIVSWNVDVSNGPKAETRMKTQRRIVIILIPKGL